MPVPIVCLDARLCQFADAFAGCFSAPHWLQTQFQAGATPEDLAEVLAAGGARDVQR